MEDTRQEQDVFKSLYRFYESSREWIKDYTKYVTKFDVEKVIRNVSRDELNSRLANCKVLILTANSVEQNILTYKLSYEINCKVNTLQKLEEIYADNCVYQFASLNNIDIVHIHTNSTSSYTKDGSANVLRSAFKRFRPKLVVSLGVAFGIDPEKQQLGQVIISDQVIPYDIFNKDNNNDFTLRTDDIFTTHEALNAWNVLLRNKSFELESEQLMRKSLIERSLEFGWKKGTMLSGGSVLSNKEKKRALLKAARKNGIENVIGGEMEGSGVYSECKRLDIPCVIIKGICDWGEEKNSWETIISIIEEQERKKGTLDISEGIPTNDLIKDCVQGYAMDNATETLFRLLRYDSEFLDTYTKSSKDHVINLYKGKHKLATIKRYISLKKDKLRKYINIYFLVLMILFACYIMSNRILGLKLKNVYFSFGDGLQVISVLLAIFFVIDEKLELYPVKIHDELISFDYYKLGIASNTSFVIKTDFRYPIYNVVVFSWNPRDKTIYDIKEYGNFKSNTSMKLEYLTNKVNRSIVLQIQYELTNGDCYVHLISKKEADVYCERIFFVDGSKYVFIYKRCIEIKDAFNNKL